MWHAYDHYRNNAANNGSVPISFKHWPRMNDVPTIFEPFIMTFSIWSGLQVHVYERFKKTCHRGVDVRRPCEYLINCITVYSIVHFVTLQLKYIMILCYSHLWPAYGSLLLFLFLQPILSVSPGFHISIKYNTVGTFHMVKITTITQCALSSARRPRYRGFHSNTLSSKNEFLFGDLSFRLLYFIKLTIKHHLLNINIGLYMFIWGAN